MEGGGSEHISQMENIKSRPVCTTTLAKFMVKVFPVQTISRHRPPIRCSTRAWPVVGSDEPDVRMKKSSIPTVNIYATTAIIITSSSFPAGVAREP